MPTSVWQRRQNESLGHLHQRYSLVDRSHDVEFPRWNNGRAEGGLGMQIPHCTHSCFKQSILINISCNENLLVRKKLKLFCLPRGRPLFFFSPPFLILVCVMSFSGRPSWKKKKKETKHLVIMGLKRTSFSLLSGAHDSLNKPRPNVLKVQKHWDPRTIWHGCSHSSTNLLLCAFYLATSALPPPRARSTDRRSGWQLHITVPHCSVPHHFHYTVILNYQQRWTGKDEWHIPASGAATAWLQRVLASPALCHARQERAGQVSGQGAALILHKYGGNPLPPSSLKTIHLCRNGRRYSCAYTCSSYDYM